MKAPPIAPEAVAAFLRARYGHIQDLEPLAGGFWSTAFGFRAHQQELVVRFGTERAWFEAEEKAMAFDSPALPVPDILEIGEGLGGVFAISRRRYGIPLEAVTPDQVEYAAPMLARLLEALFSVPKTSEMPVGWQWTPATPSTWRQWLRDTLVDQPGRHMAGWRSILSAEPDLDRLLGDTEDRLARLVEACPERRDLVHRDLLHGNVLVTEDAGEVTAVFSWKCSVRGDFLYDVAWCTFWSGLHPGIAAADAWSLILSSSVVRAEEAALADATARHHCYELHIGAEHLAFNAWAGKPDALAETAQLLRVVLERGPLSPPEAPPRRAAALGIGPVGRPDLGP